VDEAIAWGRQRGRDRVVVDTGAANRDARDFYAALGFDDEDVTLSKGSLECRT
jgi:GNAT superfamily N-acetyltransferase